MLKVISLLRRREDIAFESFRRWAQNDHPRLAVAIPGLRAYRMNVCVAESAAAPCDALSEMWFADDAARIAGFATEAGKAAAADASAHCASRTHVIVDERIVL